MAKSTDHAADWRIVDLDRDLSPALRSSYTDYRQVYALMKEARTQFEADMTAAAALPDTSRLVFGYNFGKLSIAVVPNDKPRAKPTTTLADFLAAHSTVRSI